MQHLLIKNGIKKWKNYGVENMEKKWKKNLNFFYWEKNIQSLTQIEAYTSHLITQERKPTNIGSTL